MLYYDKIDVSEGIVLAKSNSSKECMICHSWFVKHGSHVLAMLSVNISDIAIIIVKKKVIIVVLFIMLAHLKQLIYEKKSVVEDCGYI